MIKITDTVKHLIIINVLVYLTFKVFGMEIYDLLAIHFYKGELFKPWQFLTSAFMHASDGHILFNMIALWSIGSAVEDKLGRNKFLILYFVSLIGARLITFGIDFFQFKIAFNNLLNFGMTSDEIKEIYKAKLPVGKVYTEPLFRAITGIYNSSASGASGAISGVFVAFGMLFPRGKVGIIFLPIMIEARVLVPLILLSDLIFAFFSNTNIGHFAHIGGAIFGFLVIWYYKHKFKKYRYRQ